MKHVVVWESLSLQFLVNSTKTQKDALAHNGTTVQVAGGNMAMSTSISVRQQQWYCSTRMMPPCINHVLGSFIVRICTTIYFGHSMPVCQSEVCTLINPGVHLAPSKVDTPIAYYGCQRLLQLCVLFWCFTIYLSLFYCPAAAAARTCHCTLSQMNCLPSGICHSPINEDDFSCLVTRSYDRTRNVYHIFQKCILDSVDYLIHCNEPSTNGLVIYVSYLKICVRRDGYQWFIPHHW